MIALGANFNALKIDPEAKILSALIAQILSCALRAREGI
jgi:hypothetical protein